MYMMSLHVMYIEMLRNEPYGPSVDLWTVGILSFELTQGKTPFSQTPSTLMGGGHVQEGNDNDDGKGGITSIYGPIIYSEAPVSDQARDFISQVRPKRLGPGPALSFVCRIRSRDS